MFGKIFLIKAYYSLYYWLAINENGATFKMAELHCAGIQGVVPKDSTENLV